MTVLLAVAAGSALAWAHLITLHGRFWTTGVRLPAAAAPDRWPSVAVIVPARNEAEILTQTLPALLRQRYPGTARVVLADDDSTDATGAVAAATAARPGPGERAAGLLPLTVVRPDPRPPGWTGKLWALQRGLAEAADADYILFTDADIVHAPDSLARLVAAAVTGVPPGTAAPTELVSVMARLRARTGWERLLLPAFSYFFGLLYPFRWVSREGGRTAAAAGGCLLIHRATLDGVGGLARISAALIDDVSLARAVKRGGARIWLGLAAGVDSVRPYPRLADLWQMVSRSAFTQLRYSAVLLALTGAGLLATFLGPPAALIAGLVAGDAPVAACGAVGWALMAATYLPTVRWYRQPGWLALSLPVAAVLYLLMTVDSAGRHWLGPTGEAGATRLSWGTFVPASLDQLPGLREGSARWRKMWDLPRLPAPGLPEPARKTCRAVGRHSGGARNRSGYEPSAGRVAPACPRPARGRSGQGRWAPARAVAGRRCASTGGR